MARPCPRNGILNYLVSELIHWSNSCVCVLSLHIPIDRSSFQAWNQLQSSTVIKKVWHLGIIIRKFEDYFLYNYRLLFTLSFITTTTTITFHIINLYSLYNFNVLSHRELLLIDVQMGFALHVCCNKLYQYWMISPKAIKEPEIIYYGRHISLEKHPTLSIITVKALQLNGEGRRYAITLWIKWWKLC